MSLTVPPSDFTSPTRAASEWSGRRTHPAPRMSPVPLVWPSASRASACASGAAVVPVPHVGRHPGETVEHEPLAVAVQHRQARVLAHGLEDAAIVGLAEAGVLLFRVGRVAGCLDRVEDAL